MTSVPDVPLLAVRPSSLPAAPPNMSCMEALNLLGSQTLCELSVRISIFEKVAQWFCKTNVLDKEFDELPRNREI